MPSHARRKSLHANDFQMASLVKDRGFVRTWWLYAVGIYFIWCQLAGVGFLLALAFMADAGIGPDYFRSVGYVAIVLFVAPLPFVMALAVVTAAVHRGIAWTMRGGRSESVAVRPTGVFPGVGRGPAEEVGRRRYSSGGLWKVILRVLAAASIVCGVFIVATNAPREVARNGPGIAVVTSLIFLVPLVFVPLAFLFSGSRVRMPEPSNAADSR